MKSHGIHAKFVAHENGNSMAQRILLDTDIGQNVDDTIALGLICASPEVELKKITTVVGDCDHRVQLARSLLETAGERFSQVPVVAGNADHVLDSLRDGDVVPVMIGPLTNLAHAIVREPAIIRKITRIVMMAGSFEGDRIDTNVGTDPVAAGIVLGCGVAAELIPWHIGDSVRLPEEALAALRVSPRALANRLADEIDAWRETENGRERYGIVRLHDPITLLSLIRPELFEWRVGTVNVTLSGRDEGRTTFREDPNGRHRVAWRVDAPAAIAFMMSRLG